MEFENICKRCGECCGSKDDPCINLTLESDGRYFCKVYETRFGPQRTASGRVFNCVPICEAISLGFTRPNCAYNENK